MLAISRQQDKEVDEKPMMHAYEVHDDLAVRVRLEVWLLLEVLSQRSVVVDLAIDGEQELSVVARERLCSSVCVTRATGQRDSAQERQGEHVDDAEVERGCLPTPTIARRSWQRLRMIPLFHVSRRMGKEDRAQDVEENNIMLRH